MMRALIAAAAVAFAAHAASAQDPLSRAKAVTNKAVQAENAHIAREQNVEQQAKPVASVAQSSRKIASPSKAAPSSSPSPTAKAGGAAAKGKQGPTKLELPSDTAGPPTSIMREVFEYDGAGRRDPFVSLLNTSELRPAISDLRLNGILYDQSGRHSVATLRDLGNNALYRVSVGSTLGRMHVAAIRVKTVVFTIDEFGTTRQDSLILGDTTKARPR